MNFEENNSRKIQDLYDECERLTSYHVVFTTKDGSKFDGIIEKVEPDCVIVLIGEDVMDEENKSNNRQYYNPRRGRRFRRRPFPYNNLGGIGILPYPYYVPPYPYYPF